MTALQSTGVFRTSRDPDLAERTRRVQKSFDRVIAACTADVSCYAAFPGPARDLNAQIGDLDAKPV